MRVTDCIRPKTPPPMCWIKLCILSDGPPSHGLRRIGWLSYEVGLNSKSDRIIETADIARRRGSVDAAREILNAAIQRSDLDWPEAIFEAMLRLEMVHGSLETLAETETIVEEASQKLTRRRAKEAEKQMAQYNYSAVQTAEAVAQDENGAGDSGAKAGPSIER